MWRFVQLSDPHLGSERDGQWNNGFVCTMMPDVMRCLGKDLAGVKPDFILATGDLASQPTRDAVFAARDLMDSLGVAYYPMGGNHDFVVEDSRKWFIEAFHAQLPAQTTYYTFRHNNLRFLVLDAWWKWADDSLSPTSEKEMVDRQQEDVRGARWELPAEQLEWLDRELSADPDTPSVIATHYPAIDLPERLKRPGMKIAGFLENGDALIALLTRHRQVKAIFSGHMHMHAIERNNGLTHVITGAMPEYPSEYREVQVFEDRMEVYTRGLSDPSFAARSLIPGRDFTAGEPCDRRVTIPLR